MRRGFGALAAIGTIGLVAGALLASTGATGAGPARGAPQAIVHIAPMVKSRFASASQAPTTAECVAQLDVPCYGPQQIETAYDEAPLFSRGITGRGKTIVIVDPFGSPTIRTDLATFDAAYALRPPPSFGIIRPAGAVPPFDPTNAEMAGWAGETTLDVEWAHAVAPGANILLVETPVAEMEGATGFPQIIEAENYVVDHHLGDVISQSFEATEETFPSLGSLLSLRSAYVNAYDHGITVLAAAGDAGATDYVNAAATLYSTTAVTTWPPSDPLVTGVGGTQLQLNASGQRLAPDQVWNDTNNPTVNELLDGDAGPNPLAGGGGVSSVFSRPAYQNGVASVVGTHRGVPDISMSAACSGLVVTYASFPGETAGWYVNCGTSEATPLFAGVVALADQLAGHPLGLLNPKLYALSAAHAPGIVDVTTGNNTVSFDQGGVSYTVDGYQAGPGYDLASGVGTVDAAALVPELAGVPSGRACGCISPDHVFGSHPSKPAPPWRGR